MRNTRTNHFITLLSCVALVPAAHAQIATDGTLGAATSLTGPNYSIPSTLGQTFGPNLFHSFRDFNLAMGDSATFGGPNNIANILARVTGGNASNIDGRLASTIPGVNFFFLNPSGVVFGPHAQVDIGGSFVASTADFARLKDGGVFHAQNPAASVLTSAPPAAFGFLNPQPSPIEINGSTLQMKAGKSLSLIGGDVRIKGGARLEVSEGGSIMVRGTNLSLRNAELQATNTITQGGGIDISLTSNLKMGQNSSIVAATEGVADSGHITIQADSVILDAGGVPDSAIIATQTLAPVNGGASGDIAVTSRVLRLANGAVITTDTESAGNGGSVIIQTSALHLLNGGEISADTDGSGNGGSVIISANNVIIDAQTDTDVTGISAETTEPESGVGGSITIAARTLQILGGGSVSTSSFGAKRSGDITIILTDGTLRLVNGGNVSSNGFGDGAGGNIVINANEVLIDDMNGEGLTGLTSDSSGIGGGGGITVTGQALNVVNGGVISTDADGQGNGGTVNINVTSLRLFNGGEISSDTDGQGDGGSVIISAKSVILNGQGDAEATGLSAGTKATNGGKGGDIRVNATNIHILNGASITAASEGNGDAGTIELNAANDLLLPNHGSIGTAAPQSNGGNINIKVGNMVRLSRSSIVSLAQGDGGNIALDSRFVILDKSLLKADAINGSGGNISITANVYLPSADTDISASSQFGVAGNIEVQSPNTNVGASLVRLTTNPLTAESYLQERCLVLRRGQSSSFTVRRQIAAPPGPSGLLPSGGK